MECDRSPAGYGNVKAAAKYCGVSVRTLRTWIKEGVPHFRLKTGTILLRYSDLDSWLSQFAIHGNEVDAILDDVLSDL